MQICPDQVGVWCFMHGAVQVGVNGCYEPQQNKRWASLRSTQPTQLFQADGQIGADAGMAVEHTRKRHTAHVQAFRGVLDAEPQRLRHIFTQQLAGMRGVSSSSSTRR